MSNKPEITLESDPRFAINWAQFPQRTPLIIVAAPSGAGKSSFIDRICREESRLRDTINYTTRPMRAGESEGYPYHFVSKNRFHELLKENFFVEWATVHTNLYGMPFYQLREAWTQGLSVIMDIDVQGMKTIRSRYPDLVKTIFILPPSLEELRRRILIRDGKKPPPDLEIRLRNASIELQEAPVCDFRIVNDNFEVSFQEFKKLIEELLGPR